VAGTGPEADARAPGIKFSITDTRGLGSIG
jgi:hypothetical protein